MDIRKQHPKYKLEIVWRNVIILSILHLIALYGLYSLVIARKCQLNTFIFQILWAIAASFGITGGAHRLWTHRSYKANLPLRLLYLCLMSMIFANDIFAWARDHRTHHKFTETDADPHNAKRGLFFSHVGWLLVRRHPDVTTKGNTISYEDLKSDPVVMFHKKHYGLLMLLGTFVLPTVIPLYLWGETHAFTYCILRYVVNIHIVWSLNSFAHLYGCRPYDKNIRATENAIMEYLTIGEGFHNYHHVFPWDYKAAEFGNDGRNLTTYLLDFFAWIGWATELKTASREMIRKRALRTGDGSWKTDNGLQENGNNAEEQTGQSQNEEKLYWGWDDPDIQDDNEIRQCDETKVA